MEVAGVSGTRPDGGGESSLATDFPETADRMLERLGRLHELTVELTSVRRALAALAVVPLETSVSLRRSTGSSELRATLGIRPRPNDPDGREALRAALLAVEADPVVREVADTLASVAPPTGAKDLSKFIALRAREDGHVRLRPATWVGGKTVDERALRISVAMRRLGLEEAATLHDELAALLVSNPFTTIGAYGLGIDLDAGRVLGAKTYFTCEWADVALDLLRSRVARALDLEASEAVVLLAECAREESRKARWLLEVSFELPRDPATGVRAKAYLPAKHLAANEVDGHEKALALAARLGVVVVPYERLLSAARPAGLRRALPCSIMLGVSLTETSPSLEVYLSDPRRAADARSP
jgi:hypothetical protein